MREIAKKPLSIVVLSSILIFFSSWPAFFLVRQGILSQGSNLFFLAVSISALCLMFLVPALVVQHVFRQKLANFGLSLPENMSKAVKLGAVITLVFLPIMFWFSKQASFQDYYAIKDSLLVFTVLSLLINGIYYFAEEFMFRGFLLFGLFFGLGNRLGSRNLLHSFWIVNLLFAFFHLSKPLPEVFLAFFLGISLSYLSYKTKSFIPAVVVHFILAFILNLLINFS